ncbi:MAG: hypothetical protein M5U30_11155 [Burkholderiaceae bacterium]|nr:hypothetical protein [Burkholderiaceae bacterium]
MLRRPARRQSRLRDQHRRALEARGVRDARLERIARRLLAAERRRRETAAA